MDDIILFRGKRLDNGEWVEGDFIHRRIWSSDVSIIRVSDNGFDSYEEYEVDPSTVGQFVKKRDRNGVRIFEHDIVTIRGSKKQGLPAEIRYNREGASFEIARVGYNPITLYDANEWCEVIGNIHDNPELLEVTSNGTDRL